MIQDKIDKLRNELDSLEREQARCNHKFGKPYHDLKEFREFDYKNVGHGSDFYPEICGSHIETKSVWRRKCSICGKMEETEKIEPVVVGTRPVFN